VLAPVVAASETLLGAGREAVGLLGWLGAAVILLCGAGGARGATAGRPGKYSLTNRAARFMLCQPSRGSVLEMKNIIGIIIPIIIDIVGIRPGGVGADDA